MSEEAYKRYLADIEAILVKAQHPPVLSRRDCFAMAAMQGMLASNRDERDSTFDWLAEDAVNAADTLIKALNAPQPTDTDAGGK